MRVTLTSVAALIALVQPPTLAARFIGNMAVAVSDGAATVITDFPYQSGYSGYMTYSAEEIRSSTPATLALITHRHADHWDRGLFEKTGWSVAGPGDVVSGLPAGRVVSVSPRGTFGAVQIEPLETPHAGIGHYSYVVTWHGKRLYFSGDTESPDHLVALRNLDVAFVSPWLYRSAIRRAGRIDARRVVIYHHTAGEAVPDCREGCILPEPGETIRIP
jgi:L-ascorbate metabolism protein UlaG (beta-lactamase superfamily)